MYQILRASPSIKMNDLQVSIKKGWAYQQDIQPFTYEKEYWDKYIRYESNDICDKLNDFRTSISTAYADKILDIGIGSGSYLKSLKCEKYGYDVNEHAVLWLKENNLWHDPYKDDNSKINGFCFWDVLEHMEEPNNLLCLLPSNSYIFVSMPIFNDITMVHTSKHYRKNEHLCYFTAEGFIGYLELAGFTVQEIRSDEITVGRENILTFVAKKDVHK